MTSANTSATNDDGGYTVIVARRGDHFLMVRHRERGWELPGGKVETGEGPVHCALREFREETGHLLGAPKFVLKMQRPNGTCFVFTGHLGTQVGGMDDDAIVGMDWFEELPEDLAFPDDPYEEMGQALGLRFR